MLILKYQNTLERIDQLIRLKATGAPTEFARKLNISKSTVYEYLKTLKVLGAEIVFDKEANSFIYIESGKLELMRFEKYEVKDLEKIIGGKNNIIFFNESENIGLESNKLAKQYITTNLFINL